MAGKNIYFNIDTEYLIESDGAIAAIPPHIKYGESAVWDFYVKRVSAAIPAVVSNYDLSDAVSWEFAIAGDLLESTAVWVRVLSVNIDSSGSSAGLLSITIDAAKADFLTAIDGLYKQDCYARLKGLVAGGGAKYVFLFKIKASADNDPNGGTPGANPSNYPTWAEALASFEKIRSFALAGINMKSVAVSTLWTCPTGYSYLLKSLDAICESISGVPATLATIEIIIYWAAGGTTTLFSTTLTKSTAGELDPFIITNVGKTLTAGDAVKISVTGASTYTTHTLKALIDGILMLNSGGGLPVDSTATPLYLTDTVTGITYQQVMTSGVVTWVPVP